MNTDTSWTGGPWHYECDEEFGQYYVCHPQTICTTTTVVTIERPDGEADAKLISAAPDLYDALTSAVHWLENERNELGHDQAPELKPLISECWDALAKARGFSEPGDLKTHWVSRAVDFGAKILPDCMAPDGAEPCEGYKQLLRHKEWNEW